MLGQRVVVTHAQPGILHQPGQNNNFRNHTTNKRRTTTSSSAIIVLTRLFQLQKAVVSIRAAGHHVARRRIRE
jgi:hypothetical protein